MTDTKPTIYHLALGCRSEAAFSTAHERDEALLGRLLKQIQENRARKESLESGDNEYVYAVDVTDAHATMFEMRVDERGIVSPLSLVEDAFWAEDADDHCVAVWYRNEWDPALWWDEHPSTGLTPDTTTEIVLTRDSAGRVFLDGEPVLTIEEFSKKMGGSPVESEDDPVARELKRMGDTLWISASRDAIRDILGITSRRYHPGMKGAGAANAALMRRLRRGHAASATCWIGVQSNALAPAPAPLHPPVPHRDPPPLRRHPRREGAPGR